MRRVVLPDAVTARQREQRDERSGRERDGGDPPWADEHWPCMYKANLALATRTRYAVYVMFRDTPR
jgi:hypothetical protein